MNKRTKKKLTQYDIAHIVGVSQTTVSHVMNNNTSIAVPEETRQRILNVIKEQGYILDHRARSLRTGKSYTIASVIPDITNPFYPAFVRGIQDIAEVNSYNLVTYNTDGFVDKEQKCLQLLQQGQVDGLIMSPFNTSLEDLRPLLEHNVPIVVLGQPLTEEETGNWPVDTLWVDPVAAAKAAVNYLVQKGHLRIAILTSRLGSTGFSRLEGYRQALLEAGLPFDESLVIWCKGYSEKNGYEGIKELLKMPDLPTAVFAVSDLLAIGALHGLKEVGVAVPQRIAVMGLDDIPAAQWVSPALTTISQFQEKLGRRAAEMLFERLQSTEPLKSRGEVMPFELIIRESA